MLSGGPGNSGEAWLNTIETRFDFDLMGLLDGDTALLLPDHRGTGLSSPLDCEPTLSVPECAESLVRAWGRSGLSHFTTTAAALDLEYLMAALSVPEVGVENVHVLGISYGTLWAQRLLRVRSLPVPATMIIDGVCPPDDTWVTDRDVSFDIVGRSFLNACLGDRYCSARFNGRDPAALLQMIVDAQRENTTSTCLSRNLPKVPLWALKMVMSVFLKDRDLRVLLPPLVLRLIRCNEGDVAVLRALLGPFQSPPQEIKGLPATQSQGLAYNIMCSEMLTPTPEVPLDLAALGRLEDSLLFTVQAFQSLQLYEAWPRYDVDSHFSEYPDIPISHTALLVLNGDVDPQTPLFRTKRAWESHFAYDPHATFVVVPGAPHVTVRDSPVFGSRVPCGMSMAASFILSRGTALDSSCLDHLVPNDWSASSNTSKKLSATYFGTPDAWGV